MVIIIICRENLQHRQPFLACLDHSARSSRHRNATRALQAKIERLETKTKQSKSSGCRRHLGRLPLLFICVPYSRCVCTHANKAFNNSKMLSGGAVHWILFAFGVTEIRELKNCTSTISWKYRQTEKWLLS